VNVPRRIGNESKKGFGLKSWNELSVIFQNIKNYSNYFMGSTMENLFMQNKESLSISPCFCHMQITILTYATAGKFLFNNIINYLRRSFRLLDSRQLCLLPGFIWRTLLRPTSALNTKQKKNYLTLNKILND
jgi:hypothetical protein